jgi:peptidoglycan hydrolase-like protein with peptidoglycan-binding domain
MPTVGYLHTGLVLQKGASGRTVRDLQHDLRSLGYLKAGIDGQFGPGTELAVMALQHELLKNHGTGKDGDAPVKLTDYNRGRVWSVNGRVDQKLAACISDMLDDNSFPKLPYAVDAKAENQKIAVQIASLSSQLVPTPFLLAVLNQESGLKHYHEPCTADDDTFIVVGLDRNSSGSAKGYAVTSRGYGAGQYTLFHHPPTAAEVQEVMLDPANNVLMAISELREKFDHFVMAGRSQGSSAQDRIAEFGNGGLRLCRYGPDDDHHMRDCKMCAVRAGVQSIVPGVTPFYAGAGGVYATTQYYSPAPVTTVPARADFRCDWPYATRRYNGSGVNSYWYQALVLNHLLQL